MQTKPTFFVCTPFQKPRLFVSTKIVEGAANGEVASARSVGGNMEVVFIRPDVFVAAGPQHIARGIDDRALTSVVWAHEDIEAGREFQL